MNQKMISPELDRNNFPALGRTSILELDPRANLARGYSREGVLFVSLLLLFALFGLTALVARLYHKQIHMLADYWFAQGETAFQSGDAAAALTDYRNALVFSPANERFQFHLAQALATTGRPGEARAYLLNLLSESPGSGEINLALARIGARQGAMQMALRYYHGAIYGEWDADPIAARWQVRREFSEYLLDHPAASRAEAEAELIQLADNTLPSDIPRVKIAGNLLLRAEMSNRALAEFQIVLAANLQDDDALAGAGTAAFQLGHYAQTLEYLNRLPREKRADPQIAELIQNAANVLASDPFLPGLSAVEKGRRTASAVAQVTARLEECAHGLGETLTEAPPRTEIQQLYARSQQMHLDWSERNLKRHPERVDAAISFVFGAENLAAQRCGEPQGGDRSLLLLMRSPEGGRR